MKRLMPVILVIVFITSCVQDTKPKSADPMFSKRMDSITNQASNFPEPDPLIEKDSIRKLVNFILSAENKNRFTSQKFFDSLKSVEVVSIIDKTVYTLYYDYEWNYLSISTRPNTKVFTPIERLACADLNLNGDPDFGNKGDSTVPKNKAKYYAISLFASSDENQFVEHEDYWQNQYNIFLKDIFDYYKL